MAAQQRPNILWYCTDQQRWDTIRALGNPHINTPNIDAFLQTGVAFNRAYCNSTICTPSRASFLTGRYPNTTHVHRNGAAYFPPHEVLVTKLLADAGYDCGLIGKLHLSRCKDGEKRPDDGYRVFHWSHHPYPNTEQPNAYTDWLRDEKQMDPFELYNRVEGYYGPGVPAELQQATWATEMMLRFLNEEREDPWMMSINIYAPHPPFDPPQDYLDRYDPSKLPHPLFRESDIEHQKHFKHIDQQVREAINPYAFDPALLPEQPDMGREFLGAIAPAMYEAREVKAAYYALIELIDAQFGRIVDALRDSGQLENTIIIFTSDHGELLGDHGLIFKGCRFFEGLVHVPLIISYPERYRTNVQSYALVELVDIAPTILEAAGETVPAYMQGRSLHRLLSRRAKLHEHKRYVTCEYHDAIGGYAIPGEPDHSHGSMYFDGRYKMCVYRGHETGELYDLVHDPGEFRNMWHDRSQQDLKLRIMRKHMDAMLATSGAGVPREGTY